MDDIYLDTVTYTEILESLDFLKGEVANLDQDSLIDEISGLQHNVVGADSSKIQSLLFKGYADIDLTNSELEYLRNVYVLFYCPVCVMVDDEEDYER